MATVSTRIDDNVKNEAEYVADEIGISLSTAINIFLKRFVAENGFPFDVTVPRKNRNEPFVNTDILDASVKKAIADPNNLGLSHQFTYIDPETNKPITVERKEK